MKTRYAFFCLLLYLLLTTATCDPSDFTPPTYRSSLSLSNGSGVDMAVGVVFTNADDVEGVSNSLFSLTHNASTNLSNRNDAFSDGRGYNAMRIDFSNSSFQSNTGSIKFTTTSVRPNFNLRVIFLSNEISKNFPETP